jgi:hypothetical protein
MGKTQRRHVHTQNKVWKHKAEWFCGAHRLSGKHTPQTLRVSAPLREPFFHAEVAEDRRGAEGFWGRSGEKATQATNYRSKTVSFVALESSIAVRGNKGLMTTLTARARMPMSVEISCRGNPTLQAD